MQEIGEKIRLIESLNSPDGQVAANVGKIEGGVAANVVPEMAFMEFELRFWDGGIMCKTLGDMKRRITNPVSDGVRLELKETSLIAPWQPSAESRRIFDLACGVGRAMGLELSEEKRGGISDSNWVRRRAFLRLTDSARSVRVIARMRNSLYATACSNGSNLPPGF